MPYWKESWGLWLLIYLLGAILTLHLLLFDEWNWLAALVALSVWYVAQQASVRRARWSRTVASAAVSALLQLVFLILFGGWVLGWFPGARGYWIASLPFLAGGAVAAVALESRNTEPLPRYGLEALLITCFLAAYLLALFRVAHSPLVALAVIHAGMLAVAIVRNARVVIEHLEPVGEGAYVRLAWNLRFREPRGLKAVGAAMALPSGVLGAVAVVAECVALAITALT